MQETTERRQQMLEYISIHRHVQYQDLMDEFHISKKTAQRDVEILSCSYPIYTRTTCAGGIFAMEGWYASKRAAGRLISSKGKVMLLFNFTDAEMWKGKKAGKDSE